MTIDELLQDRRIQRQKVAAVDIKALISRAKSDIDSARFMLPRDSVWAFSIAYNGFFQATRALMFSN